MTSQQQCSWCGKSTNGLTYIEIIDNDGWEPLPIHKKCYKEATR